MQLDMGKIELGGITFSKDTNIEEVLKSPKFTKYVGSGPVGIFTSERVNLGKYAFKTKILFINKKISKIRLIPVNLEVKDPEHPDEKYQEEKKRLADNFLREELGEPSRENESVLYYEFTWGSVASVAFHSGRSEYTGGFIEIAYKENTEKNNKY